MAHTIATALDDLVAIESLAYSLQHSVAAAVGSSRKSAQ